MMLILYYFSLKFSVVFITFIVLIIVDAWPTLSCCLTLLSTLFHLCPTTHMEGDIRMGQKSSRTNLNSELLSIILC